jgi:hypothetical protein
MLEFATDEVGVEAPSPDSLFSALGRTTRDADTVKLSPNRRVIAEHPARRKVQTRRQMILLLP